MFDGSPSITDSESHWSQESLLDVVDVLAQCSWLPEDVRSSAPSRVFERTLDSEEFRRITTMATHDPLSVDTGKILAARKKALRPFLESQLVCVFIRLPGGHYTIEIEPISEKVVHWEWQETG